MKAVAITIGVILALVLVGFGLQAAGLYSFKFFAPKYEEAKRDVYLNSREFHRGTAQELYKMRLEHAKLEDDIARGVLENRALSMIAEMDRADLPADLRAWIESIEGKALSSGL